MTPFELVLFLLVAVLIVVEVSGRIGVPYPILLVIGGLMLAVIFAAIPGLPEVSLDPDVVLLIFLPPLIYIAAYLTPLRDLRQYRRAIALLSVGLVLFTIVVVGAVTVAVVPGIALSAALTLGAIVAPTDAIAATSIFRRLNTPRRIIAILEGEALLNDAAALVAYRTAVAATSTAVAAGTLGSSGSVDGLGVIGEFLVAAIGGIAVGLIVGWISEFIYDRMSNPPVEVALSLVIPYLAYLPADALHFSGVLAAVVAGLLLGRGASRLLSSDTRLLGGATWQILTFLLNGFAFILIGLQLPIVVRGLAGRPASELAFQVVAVVLAVVIARFVWVFPSTYLPRWLVPSIRRVDPVPPVRAVVVVSWAGLRGAVSLAAALALPEDFPERNLLLLLTFAVILATLVGQGLSLPLLLKWFRLADDGGEEREEILARSMATEAGLAELRRLRLEWPGHVPLLDGLEASLRDRSEHLPTEDEDESAERRQERIEHEEIRHNVIAAQRTAVIELRDRGEINDEVLRRVERELDLEELRAEG